MKRIPLLARIRRFVHDERGAIAVMGAIIAVCGIGALAIGVDAITLYFERRKAQGAVDLAAIAAARDISRAEAAAAATIGDNRIPAVQSIVITRGHYAADAATPAALRFVANATPQNAVRVELANEAPLYFGRGIAKRATYEVRTAATAVSTAEAAFTIGSRLLSLNGGVLNAVLGAALGGNISLSVMDYNNLANFNVDLFRFADALAIKAGGNIGTYDQLAASKVSVGNVIDALVSIAQAAPGTAATQLSLNTLKNQSNAGAVKIPAGKLISFGPQGYLALGQGGALSARASALSILNAAAGTANGANQAEVLANLTLPGLTSVQLGVTVGERPQSSPWIAVGEAGASVYTAQTRIRLIVTAGGSGLLNAAAVTLPIYIDVASAKATLSNVTCGANPATDTNVSLAVTPAVINAWIAQPSSAWRTLSLPPDMQPAALVAVPLLGLSVTGRAQAQMTNMSAQSVSFRWSDIASGTPKTVKTADFTQSLVSGLVDQLVLNVNLGPLSLLTPALVTGAVKATLQPLTPALDALVNDVLASLGVNLGEADVWVNGVRCDGAALVN
ncbi:MAG TPA: TadG family pilus assembly protein [Xanthobacteraceae bacterium]|nr:TadG family pilus assembly protein [Xanthobacteraceae bacterium]